MKRPVEHSAVAAVRPGPALDSRPVEGCLRAQDGVLEASAWFADGTLVAHVTLVEGSGWTARGLQRVCMETLGLHLTPRRLMLELARPLAA